jgi:hypothetical protein
MWVYSPITALTTLVCEEGLLDHMLQYEDVVTPSGLRYVKIKKEWILSGEIHDGKNCSRTWCKWQWTCLEAMYGYMETRKGTNANSLRLCLQKFRRLVPTPMFFTWHFMVGSIIMAEMRNWNKKLSCRKGAKPSKATTFTLEDKWVLAEIII